MILSSLERPRSVIKRELSVSNAVCVACALCYDIIRKKKMDQVVIGGIEGGATHSTIVLMNSNGKVIAKSSGPGTNHFLLGMTECRKRISDMVASAKRIAGIPEDLPLTALGLSLSGCEQEETNQELVRGLLQNYPNLCERCTIGSDTEGSLAATSHKGGVTCIAGTGSNTLLINPDGQRIQCGGWGFHLGDEGSAWKISFRAIKLCFDDIDQFDPAPYPINYVWSCVKEHFKVEQKEDLLEFFYTRFDKPFIASLCAKLVTGAKEGDKLCQMIFEEAGVHLARAISAVHKKASSELTERKGGLHVLCVGSVWLSWELLKRGFVPWINKNTNIKELSLMRLTTTGAVGAAYMAADRLNVILTRDYLKNYNVFYTYNRDEEICE